MNKTPKSKAETDSRNAPRETYQRRVARLRASEERARKEASKSAPSIISRMEAIQQRFGRLQLCDRETHVQKFDAQAEHIKDLEYESRVDYESWQYDGPAEREDV